jgi:acyl-CoA synthetase (AMP-forming)/AMP-acid ligase II
MITNGKCLLEKIALDSRAEWIAAAKERYRRIEAAPLPGNIMDLVRTAARAVPDNAAMHFIETESTVSYAQLHTDIQRLANGLVSIGVVRGSRVAVMLPNVREMPTTWLALAAIGAVMVPVNVRYTGHELHYLLTNSDATHLVIDHCYLAIMDLMPSPPAALSHVVVARGPEGLTHHCWQDLLDRSQPHFTAEVQPELNDLVNIQYTSGTTGLPKGCLLTHRYWLTCAKAYSDCDGLTYSSILSPNPFFYMTPQWMLLMACYQHATLYVAPQISLTRFVGWLRRYGIEFCIFPMDIVSQVAERPDDRDHRVVRANLSIHRKELHAQAERRFGFPVRSAFGMTEIGLGMVTPFEAVEMVGSGSCGMAAPFRETRVADLDGNTLPPEQMGELLVRGPGMFLGYYNKPEATVAAFHGDWFRTGDLARQDTAGFVTILGRIKEMIRRAGENISATEVESALLAIPEIAEAAAIAVPDDLRGEEVKAYVTLQAGMTAADLPPERIVEHCRERLAAFKVPRFIEYRDTPLPRSTSGKVRKPDIVAEKNDLRQGSWDRVLGNWV